MQHSGSKLKICSAVGEMLIGQNLFIKIKNERARLILVLQLLHTKNDLKQFTVICFIITFDFYKSHWMNSQRWVIYSEWKLSVNGFISYSTQRSVLLHKRCYGFPFLHNRRWDCEVIKPRDPSAPLSSVWRRGRAALMGNTELGINIHTAALLVMSVCIAKGEGVYGSALKAMVSVMRTMLARVRPCWMTHSITMLHGLERDLQQSAHSCVELCV